MPGVGLTATGTLSYNGVVFTGAMNVRATSEPVMDDSGRTTIYVLHRIQVDSMISAGSVLAGDPPAPTDATLLSMRTLLSEPGGSLVFVSKGFGVDLVVGGIAGAAGLAKRDVVWGPKPKILSWEPVGNNLACQVSWSVEVAVPLCRRGARYQDLLAFNYQVTFSVDEQAKTTRTISGYAQIANARVGAAGRKILKSADEEWVNVFKIPKILEGFKRTHTRTISKDKSRLDFSITDTEIASPNPFPEFHPVIRATHRVRSKTPLHIHEHSLSMSITRNAGVDGSASWAFFVQFVQSRMAAATGYCYLIDLEASEDVFGYESTFSAKYRITKCMIDIVSESGLYTPVEGTTWVKWKDGNPAYQHEGGESRLKELASYDYIVDLCGPKRFPKITGQAYQTKTKAKKVSVLKNETPDEDDSYVSSMMQITPSRRRPVVRQSTLQEPDEDRSQGNENAFSYPESDGIPDLIQQGGQSSYDFMFEGAIRKLAAPPVRPKLKEVGGKAVVEVASKHALRLVANHFGITEHLMRWSTKYVMAKSPGAITKTAPNESKPKGLPEECLDEKGEVEP